jgi:hypothetical protein
MKVTIIERTEQQCEEYDYRQAYQIDINSEKMLLVSDGEPEDSNLSRDFSDVYSIPDLMRKAHEAGLKGETLEFTREFFDN